MAATAMCGWCGEDKPKGQLLPAASGGAKCKDWFECAQRREALLRQNISTMEQMAQARVQTNGRPTFASTSTSAYAR